MYKYNIMRNEPLTGFILHQKPYRENRSLTYFFSQEFGLVNGIGKKNLPLFLPISLFATGKNELKNFSQSQIIAGSELKPLSGQAMFAGLYLNELLVKLLRVEVPCETLWQAYQQSLEALAYLTHSPHPNAMLKFILRYFEQKLFEELGYAIDFMQDSVGETITPNQHYHYQLQSGFVAIVLSENTGRGQAVFLGQDLQDWQTWLDNFAPNEAFFSQKNIHLLNQMGKLYRQVIDNLVNYQVLQSRELWRELTKYH